MTRRTSSPPRRTRPIAAATSPPTKVILFDKNGNRTMTGDSTGSANLITSDGTFNYTHDADGNQTVRTRISNSYATDYKTTYSWDYRNRLTDVEYFDNNGVLTKHVHYVFDVFDHLLATETDTTGGGSYNQIERYVLDVSPEIPMAGVPGTDLAQPALQCDGGNNLKIRYLAAVDRIFAEGAVPSPTQADTTPWGLVDNLGSERYVIDNSSNVEDQLVYNSFGVVSYESNPSIHHFAGYAGGHVDPNTGLVMFYHRPYEPATGHWLTPDPEGFAAGDHNLERYAGNQPTDEIDPSGLAGGPPAPSPAYQYAQTAAANMGAFQQQNPGGRPNAVTAQIHLQDGQDWATYKQRLKAAVAESTFLKQTATSAVDANDPLWASTFSINSADFLYTQDQRVTVEYSHDAFKNELKMTTFQAALMSNNVTIADEQNVIKVGAGITMTWKEIMGNQNFSGSIGLQNNQLNTLQGLLDMNAYQSWLKLQKVW